MLCDFIRGLQIPEGDLSVVSPDVGNVKMANAFASQLGGDLAIVDKRRKNGAEVESNTIIGDVEGKTCLLIDDMISTAGTMCEAARLLKDHGADDIIAACTHPVLVGLAMERLAEAPISQVIVTDTLPTGERCAPIQNKLVELTTAPLFGEAISRIHFNQSISSLFKKELGGKR